MRHSETRDPFGRGGDPRGTAGSAPQACPIPHRNKCDWTGARVERFKMPNTPLRPMPREGPVTKRDPHNVVNTSNTASGVHLTPTKRQPTRTPPVIEG